MTTRVLVDRLAGEPHAILIDGDRIVAQDAEATTAGRDAVTVDATGLRAAPGFIELQVNGIGDADITNEPGSVWRVAERLVRHGVTAFLPTVVSGPPGTVDEVLRAVASPPDASPPGAAPLGVHVEGPYLAPRRRGAHDSRHLRPPDLVELEGWVRAGARMVTLAPELPGALAAIERIAADGAVAAVGHTDADAETVAAAIEAGARYATHLFNAMPPLHHRAPGPVGALLADERVTLGLIADGIHVHPLVLGLVARAGPGRVSIVSDGVGDRLGDAALRDADAGRLADGTRAGGVDGLDHGVRTFAAATGFPDAAIRAVTEVPARLLGLRDGRGEIRPGGRADLVLLDDDLHVAATIVGGRSLFLSERVDWP